ncbi:hypothetical protein FACS1894190_03670 [Spirochaetia bacterium]|nr:hypothetical protein FACS1894190_03670 [Spirochaetia bacterium]
MIKFVQELLKEKWGWEFIIGFLGWALAFFQFIINRLDKKKEKSIDRKYEVYSSCLKKFDEAIQNVQKNPTDIVKLYTDLFSTILNNVDDQKKTIDSLIKFNQEIMSFIPNSTEPLIILKSELNNLMLICSDELKQKIDELIKLTHDYNNEVQKALSLISSNGSNSSMQNLQTLGQNKRGQMIENLREEMIAIMRKEIGNEKKGNKRKKRYG